MNYYWESISITVNTDIERNIFSSVILQTFSYITSKSSASSMPSCVKYPCSMLYKHLETLHVFLKINVIWKEIT